MKKLVFPTFDCDPEIPNSKVIPDKFHPKKSTINIFQENKIFSDTPKMVVLAILRPNLRPLLGIENFFLVNLTYSYTILN